MPEIMGCVLIITYMLTAAIQDIRHREISLKLSVIFAVCGIICCIAGQRDIAETCRALMPGFLIMALSLISGGCVGIGDAVFVMICGLYMKPWQVIFAVLAGWGACAAAALMMIVRDGISGRRRLREGLPYTLFAALPAAAIELYVLMK